MRFFQTIEAGSGRSMSLRFCFLRAGFVILEHPYGQQLVEILCKDANRTAHPKKTWKPATFYAIPRRGSTMRTRTYLTGATGPSRLPQCLTAMTGVASRP